MRNIILIISLLILAGSNSATYAAGETYPVGRKWSSAIDANEEGEYKCEIMRIDSVTEVGGKEYSCIDATFAVYDDEMNVIYETLTGQSLVRETGSKVYVPWQGSGEWYGAEGELADSVYMSWAGIADGEVLVYDSSLQPGDSLLIAGRTDYLANSPAREDHKAASEPFTLYYEGRVLKLESVENIESNGTSFAAYNFEGYRYTAFVTVTTNENGQLLSSEITVQKEGDCNDTWVEGIGYLSGFELEGVRNKTFPMMSWNCVWKHDELVFVKDAGKECLNLGSLVNPVAAVQGVVLYREGNHLTATFPAVGDGGEIALYDTTGKTVHASPLRTGATTAIVSVDDLPHGVYIVTVTSTGNRPLTAKTVL